MNTKNTKITKVEVYIIEIKIDETFSYIYQRNNEDHWLKFDEDNLYWYVVRNKKEIDALENIFRKH